MDSVFDSLFSVLPIVLGILWLLRSVKRGKKQREEEAAKPRPVVKKPADEPLHFEELVNLEPGVPAATREPLVKVSENTSALAREAAEDAAARAADARKKAAATVAAKLAQAENKAREAREAKEEKAAEAARRMVRAARSEEDSSGYHRESDSYNFESNERVKHPLSRKPGSALDRISVLPPLAQGILWGTILEKPLALRDAADELKPAD